MSTNLFDEPILLEKNESVSSDETFNIPICMEDIITVCKEYSKLGYNIQHQVETIMELGIVEAISNGTVNVEAIPHIKHFLVGVAQNVYFGDACNQANDCIDMIEAFEEQYPKLFKVISN